MYANVCKFTQLAAKESRQNILLHFYIYCNGEVMSREQDPCHYIHNKARN